MTWAALQDRTNRAALAAFGQSVTVGGVSMQGDPCMPTDVVYMNNATATANVPQVVVCSEDIVGAPVGQTVVIATGPVAGTWEVVEASADGMGLTVLRLGVPL